MITAEEAREMFNYNPETGVITWRKRPVPRIRVGSVAGHRHGEGYISIGFRGKSYLAHRLAWLIMLGVWPEEVIDHVDGVRDCNKWANLRSVSQKENMRNAAIGKSNASGVQGVGWHRRANKWLSQIKVDGKVIYLGVFKIFDDAVTARKNAEEKYGFHKNHGRAA